MGVDQLVWKPRRAGAPRDWSVHDYVAEELQWTQKEYLDLRASVEKDVPGGERLDAALKQIANLDCETQPVNLAPCLDSAPTPKMAAKWRQALEEAAANPKAAAAERAAQIEILLCADKRQQQQDAVASCDANAIFALRGVINSGVLESAARATPQLIDHLLDPQCFDPNMLTDANRAELNAIARKIADEAKEKSRGDARDERGHDGAPGGAAAGAAGAGKPVAKGAGKAK
jgi:hypothetical protein